MKRKLSVILSIVLLVQFIPLTNSTALDTLSPHPIHQGMKDGGNQYDRLKYTDIANYDGREKIQEATALSLMPMPWTKSNNFQPNQSITYLEALVTLVEAVDQGGLAQQIGEEQNPVKAKGIRIVDLIDNWAQGYIETAQTLGIVTDQELDEITFLNTQETEKLNQDIEKRMENLENTIRNYEERGFTAADLLSLQNQYRDQLTTYRTWYQPVSRQQVAAWTARAIQLEGTYGGQMKKIYDFDDMRQIDTEKAPLIESLLEREIIHGRSPSNFAPNPAMTRGEFAQIMAKVHDQILPIKNTTIKEGKILAIEDIEDKSIKKKALTIHNQDDSKNLLLVEDRKRDFPVLRLGKIGRAKSLEKGDWVKYYIKNNEVIFAKVEASKFKTVQGFVEIISTDNQQLVMKDFNDERHIFTIQPFAKIQINGKDTKFKDLIYGLEITVTTDNKRVTEIQGYLEEDPARHGYIPPGSKNKVGDILFIDKNSLELRVDGKREKYRITDFTQILRSDKPANLFEIKEGDRVILSFDDIYSADIATLRAEDHERHIAGVYRGSIEQINSRNKEVILKDPYIYKDGRWVKDGKDQIKLRAEGNQLYEGSRPILLNTLNTRKDQEAYVAVENSYSVPKIAKLLLKNGSSILYEEKISDINFGTNRMIVDNTSFTLHPGTIVIKNNRLVDNINLNKGQGVYVAGDILRGNRNAALVAIEYDSILDERIDDTRLVIYRGSVADIHQYGITLGRLGYRLDYLKLDDNQWVENRGSRKMTLTEDTYIFDSDIKKEIDPSYFIDTRYIDPEDIEDKEIRERIEDRFYLDKQAYFLVKEYQLDGETYQEVLGLNLTPADTYEGGKLHIEHSAIGQVQEVDLDNSTIKLNNTRYWNNLSKRWDRASGVEEIDTEKAIILVNDQPLDKDQLHKIRPQAQAYIIKSKDTSTKEEAYVIVIEQ